MNYIKGLLKQKKDLINYINYLEKELTSITNLNVNKIEKLDQTKTYFIKAESAEDMEIIRNSITSTKEYIPWDPLPRIIVSTKKLKEKKK